MSDINVTPEDRERIVDMRFGELFDRHADAKLDARIDRKILEWAELASQNAQAQQQPRRATSSQPLPPSDQQPRPRRRSAFDIALAQALGF